MTSTNDGKDVKSNQTSGPKGKSFYIDLYKSLEAGLSKDCDLSERTQKLCEAWRRIHSLCVHSTDSTHRHLLSWLQRHTARTVLQTKWQNPESRNEHILLEEAIDAFIAESQSSLDGDPPWQKQLVARGEWFKQILSNPWGHPVLGILLNPDSGESPSDEELLTWLKEERDVMFIVRLRQLASSKDCQDLALRLASSILDRVRACMETPNDDLAEEFKEKPETSNKLKFTDILKLEAGFTSDVMELIIDIEFVLLHKRGKLARCIELAKQIPLRDGYQLVERLRRRLEISPREKKLWKNAKEVATLIAQVVITRCMVVPVCSGVGRVALEKCTRSLVRLVEAPRLASVAAALAAPAATAAHLHTLATAVDERNTTERKPFVCELYVRAITAGMNELERLKLNPDKAPDARLSEQTLSEWFIQLGDVLSTSERMRCECTLTAFSVHPNPYLYEKIKEAPDLPPVALDNEAKEEAALSEFGSWASDSRSQTNFVKTSETLKLKQTQNQANVLSTAILNEGEALGLSPELCQDIAVLLSGPRLKTLSWDMNREMLLENCRTYMDRTDCGTRALTTELKYLNLDLREYQHLPEEEDDDSDIYYGIEKGYEYLVDLQEPEEISGYSHDDPEATDSAHLTDVDTETFLNKSKKKTKNPCILSESEDLHSPAIVECKRVEKKKERPHSKERCKERKPKTKTKLKDPLDLSDFSIEGKEDYTEQKKNQNVDRKDEESIDGTVEKKHHKSERKKETKDKDKKKEKKERKRKEKALRDVQQVSSLSNLIGMKVTKLDLEKPSMSAIVTDSDHDSQGQSSIYSVNETDVLFDGLYSMDEFKSPEKSFDVMEPMRSKDPNVANETIRTNHPVTNRVVSKPSSKHIDTDRALNKLTGVTESVKNSITKLLQFRRQKILGNTLDQRSVLIKPSPDTCIDKNVNLPTSQASVNYQYRSYVNKSLLDQHTNMTKLNNLNNKDCLPRPVIQYGHSPKHNNNAIPSGTKILNSTLDRLPFQNTNMVNDQKISERNIDISSGHKSMVDPHKLKSAQGHQNDFEQFVKELQESINAGTGHYYGPISAKRDIKPVSRMTPVVPKSEPKNIPSAKQLKITEQAPTTFSRLNYYKSNLLTNEVKVKQLVEGQLQKPQTQSNIAELDRIITEHKNTRIRAAQYSSNSVIKSTGPNQNISRTSIINPREHTTTKNTDALSLYINPNSPNLIKNQNKQYSNVDIKRPLDPNKQTSLTEKDQQDLLLLLRQQSKQNLTKPKIETPIGGVPSPQTNATRILPTHNMQSSLNMDIWNHKLVTVGNDPNSDKSNSSLNASSAAKSLGKPIIVKTELSHSKNLNQTYNKIQKVEVIDSEGRSIKSGVDVKHVESKQTDWESVMDAILKHKTPSRGPNALDMALRNDVYTNTLQSNLRNQRIVRTPPRKSISPTHKDSNIDPKKLISSLVNDHIKNNPNTLRQSNTDINIKVSKERISGQISPAQKVQNPTVEVQMNPRNNLSYINNKSGKNKVEVQTNLTLTSQHPEKKSLLSVTPKKTMTDDRLINLTSAPKKVATAAKRQNFVDSIAKEDDPFISGIPNSDYDLLEELMDDDLRQEIGELSSDEDTHRYGTETAYGKDTKGFVGLNKNVVSVSSLVNSASAKQNMKPVRNIPSIEFVKPTINSTLPVQSSGYVTFKTANNLVEKCSAATNMSSSNNKIINGSSQTPQTVIIPPKKDQNLVSNIPTYLAVPQQTALQNVVLVGSELVYHQPCVQTIHAGSSQTAFVAYNNQPNIAIYQTTQFVAPVINTLIVNNAITMSAAQLSELPLKNTPPALSTSELTPSVSCNAIREDRKKSVNYGVSTNSTDTTSHCIVYKENKNCERKVLSEVQQKQKLSKGKEICSKEKFPKISFELEAKKADQERLKNKRNAIRNRSVYHRSNNKPIALSYTPLQTKKPDIDIGHEMQHNLRSTANISTCSDSNNVHIKVDSEVSDKIKTLLPDDINNEICKENKKDEVTCSILLCSSNKSNSHTVIPSSVEVVKDIPKPEINSNSDKHKKAIKKSIKKRSKRASYESIGKIEKRITRQSKNCHKDTSNNNSESKDENITPAVSYDTPSVLNEPDSVTPKVKPDLVHVAQDSKQKNVDVKMPSSVTSLIDTHEVVNEKSHISEHSISTPIDDSKSNKLFNSEEGKVIQADKMSSPKLLQSENDYPSSPSIIPSDTDVLFPQHIQADSIPIQSDILSPPALGCDIPISTVVRAAITTPTIMHSDYNLGSIPVQASNNSPSQESTEFVSRSSLQSISREKTHKSSVVDMLKKCSKDSKLENTQPKNDAPATKEQSTSLENIRVPLNVPKEILVTKKMSKNTLVNEMPTDKSSRAATTQEERTTEKRIKNSEPEVICLDNDEDTTNDNRKVNDKQFVTAPEMKETIPQSFLDEVKIEYLPTGEKDDPLKKCVRIKLPNGRSFKATVRGQAHFNVESLFSDPALKSVFMNNLSNQHRYTVNIKQVATANQSQPGSRIQEISVRFATSNKSNTIETINLLSDDEDDNDLQYFKTESGEYKVSSMEPMLFEIHQKCFNKKCVVKLKEGTLPLPDVRIQSYDDEIGVEVIIPDKLTTPIQATTVPDLKENTEQLVTLLPRELTVTKHKRNALNIIEIDDSSNDEPNLDDNLNHPNINNSESSYKQSEKKIQQFRNLLLKDLGITDESLNVASKPNFPVEKLCHDEISLPVTMEPVKDLSTSNCDETQHEKERVSTDVNCYVKLTKCDDLVKNYNNLKQCAVKLIRCDKIRDNFSEKSLLSTPVEAKSSLVGHKDIFEEYSDDTSVSFTEPISRSGSFSILNDYNLFEQSFPKEMNRCTSPVMDAYETISLYYQNNETNISKFCRVICDTQWFLTKSQIHFQSKYNIFHDFPRTTDHHKGHDTIASNFEPSVLSVTEINDRDIYESETTQFVVPKLVTILTRLFQNSSIVDKLKSISINIPKSNKNNLKRKSLDYVQEVDRIWKKSKSVSLEQNYSSIMRSSGSLKNVLELKDAQSVPYVGTMQTTHALPNLGNVEKNDDYVSHTRSIADYLLSEDCKEIQDSTKTPTIKAKNTLTLSEHKQVKSRDNVLAIYSQPLVRETVILTESIGLNHRETSGISKIHNSNRDLKKIPHTDSISSEVIESVSAKDISIEPSTIPLQHREDALTGKSRMMTEDLKERDMLEPQNKNSKEVVTQYSKNFVIEKSTANDKKQWIGLNHTENSNLNMMVVKEHKQNDCVIVSNVETNVLITNKLDCEINKNKEILDSDFCIPEVNAGMSINNSVLQSSGSYNNEDVKHSESEKFNFGQNNLKTMDTNVVLDGNEYFSVNRLEETNSVVTSSKQIPERLTGAISETNYSRNTVLSLESNQSYIGTICDNIHRNNVEMSHNLNTIQISRSSDRIFEDISTKLEQMFGFVGLDVKSTLEIPDSQSVDVNVNHILNDDQIVGNTETEHVIQEIKTTGPCEVLQLCDLNCKKNTATEERKVLRSHLQNINVASDDNEICGEKYFPDKHEYIKTLEQCKHTIPRNKDSDEFKLNSTGLTYSCVDLIQVLNDENSHMSSNEKLCEEQNGHKTKSNEQNNSCIGVVQPLKEGAQITVNEKQSEELNCNQIKTFIKENILDKSSQKMDEEINNYDKNRRIMCCEDRLELELAKIVSDNTNVCKDPNDPLTVNMSVPKGDESNKFASSHPPRILENDLLELLDKYTVGQRECISEQNHSKTGLLTENTLACDDSDPKIKAKSLLNDSIDASRDRLLEVNLAQIVNGDKSKDICSNLVDILDVHNQSVAAEFIERQDKRYESLSENKLKSDNDGTSLFSVTVSENGVSLNDIIPSDQVEDIVEIHSNDDLKREIARIVFDGPNSEDDKQILIIDEDNLEFDELKICCIKQSELQKLIKMDDQDGDTKLKAVEYEKSTLESCYFNRDSNEFSQSSNENILQVTQDIDKHDSPKDIKKIRFKEPQATYSRNFSDSYLNNHSRFSDRKAKAKNLKRKCTTADVRIPEKKYRKGKNIDTPKLTAAVLAANAYTKEFKYLLDYCSSVKFSYSRPFHKENIDVDKALRSWPIKGNCNVEIDSQIDENLFNDTNLATKTIYDPLQETLIAEIATEYDESDYSVSCEVIDPNFQMGFGERSGRVIQNSEDGEGFIFSAATLSDVKQNQPLLLSEICDNYNALQNTRNKVEKIDNIYKCIQLKDKVRSFFKKTMIELSNEWVKQSEKDDIFFNTIENSDYAFGLNIPDFIEPLQVEFYVQVVQIGQLPVSATAQNPMTCDPRVTHVSNASPSQCSAENSPNGDSQSAIKTEYTELTTADIRLPLQNYTQHHNQFSVESQDTDTLLHTDVIIENIKEEIKQEIKEEPEINDEINDDYGISNNESYSVEGNSFADNIVYSYNANPPQLPAMSAGNTEIIFKPTEKQADIRTFSNRSMQESQDNPQMQTVQQNQEANFTQQHHLTHQNQQSQVQQHTQNPQQNQQTPLQLQNQLTQQNQESQGHHQNQQVQHPRQNQTHLHQQHQQGHRSLQVQVQPQSQQVHLTQENQQPPQNCRDEQNGLPEKSDQIAHAMNAAGITPTAEGLNNARAHALVNIISQKLRQGAVCTPSSNSYTKTPQINTMTLQQAFAQILPPPLSQTSTSENNQQNASSTSQVAPQVLHIVHGKNAAGNQITVVDNTQPCNNNAPSTTPVLHIVQNKGNSSVPTSNNTSTPQANSFTGLSLVDTGLQQGNQLLHIVNTGNQKNANTGQLLRKVNLLTNLANVQGSNEQKMLQFVCKSADGKAIQLNAPSPRGMVLRLQPIESPSLQQIHSKTAESQESNTAPSTPNNVPNKENSQQEIKSRSVYEENYAKFIQSSNKTTVPEKATSLPKFGQAFGKQVFQEGSQKTELNNSDPHLPSTSENPDSQPNDNAINLEHITQMSSPPLLLRKSPQASQAQPNLVQQLKHTISPMGMGMHGGVIYTRQIPVNIGGGQTINLITVPSTDLVDDSGSKHQSVGNQEDIESPIIKLVPPQVTQAPVSEHSEETNSHIGMSNDNSHTPQPVLTQMRIKLPMLSKSPQMVSGARLVRPSFFQIQRNVIAGANQPVYQQLVLTAAPPLGQPTIRLPQTQTNKHVKVPSESQSSPESQMSSSTLEQLREFDLVLEQVKERSTGTGTVQSNATSSSAAFTRQQPPLSKDATDNSPPANTAPVQKTQQVLYSVSNTPPLSVAYINKKTPVTIPSLTPTSSFVRSPDSSETAESPTSSSHQLARTITTTASVSNPTTSSTVSNANAGSQPKPTKPKPKPRPKAASNPPNTLKLPPAPPKTSTQKPAEDEQTTQRILYILAEYKEQVENSPDKNKPAPRRRTNLPSNPGCSSKRKKCSGGTRRSGREMSPCNGEDTCRTMGSEDSSCGTSQGDCNESCLDSHSPQDSPQKVVRKLTFENETSIPIMQPRPQPRPQPQRNVIVADGQTITVARGTAGKPTTAVLMPANYILPVSMVKGGQQIAIVTNRGPKLLTVGGGEGGTTNALLLQRLVSPAGLKPVLTRPGVRHVRLPTAALHNLQALNLTTAATVHPPDSTASSATLPNPPDLVDTRASSSPWRTDRESHNMKPERGSSPESSEPWHLPPSDYCYEETVCADNLDRTVLEAIPDRYSPDMEAQRIFDKMFDVDSKKSYMVDSHDDSPRCGYDIDASDCDDKAYHQVVHKKDGSSHRQHRLTHVSAAALRHKYAILEHELRLQKSLSEECEDLGVDSPSASELFPEAELLFAASPAHDHTHDIHHSHTPQPLLSHSGIPQPDMDDQIATDHLLRPEHIHDDRDLGLGLEDVGIVTVSEDGMQATIQLDQEEFARSHPNTTFHSEPTEEGEIQQPFTLSGLKGRHITSAIFHANRQPGSVLMSGPQPTVISQANAENTVHHNTIKYTDIDNMLNSMPGTHNNNVNLSSVLVKEDGLSRFDNLLHDSRELQLHDSRELHLSNTASTIVHSSGHTTQVIRRVCYEDDKRERDQRYLMDESDGLIAGDDAKMIGEDSSRDATLESMGDTASSPEHNTEMFWESNSASGRADFSSDSEKCCKSPTDDTSTDSSAGASVSAHMRLDSVIKEARGLASDDDVPPLRTYPAPRSLSGKTAPSGEGVIGRRASGRGVVKRGTCLCCISETPPPRPKKPRQRRPAMDFAAAN